MMPASFTVLDKLPLTPSGKIDRKALPAPDLTIQAEQLAPRSETERLLCNLWSQVLRIEIMSVNSNFFEAGGHSLLATQLVSRIRETFQVEMPLRVIFECAIVQEQAKWLDKQQRGSELPPIMPLAEGEPLVWSLTQQRLWFLAQLEGISATYNMPTALHLSGHFNETALQRAIIALIQRHDSLRLSFPVVDGPAGLKLGEVYNPLCVTDISELSEIEQQRQVTQWIASHVQTPFDLCTGPLLSLRLLKLGKQEQILLFNMHHIISDGWSMGVLIRQFGQLYNAYAQNQVPQLSKLPIQYTDYAAWQRNWLQGKVLERQLAYWSGKLDGVPELLELPTDYPRPAVMRYQGQNQQSTLDQELTLSIKQLSQQYGVTIFMTLLAAFKVLLYRYSDQNDLVVGSPIANRTLHQTEDLIGFFVNTLVLRTQVAFDQTFTSLLKQVRTMALEAYSHQELPFEYLVEQLNPSRSMSHSPLFQVMFILQNVPHEALELKDLKISFLESDNATAKFDLTLSIMESGEVLICDWEYNTDLFRADTIARMAEHFQVLLDGIIENPEQLLSQLPLLTETEQHQLVAWNRTDTDYPSDQTIVDLFQAQVDKTPDNIAVIFENQHLSYFELNSKANQLAHYLMTLGVGAETLVGICVERSFSMVIGLLGVLKAGGAYVPLDPDYPAARLAFMLEDSGVLVLLSQSRVIEQLPASKAKVISLDSEWEKIAVYSKKNPVRQSLSTNLAYVIYTSGSTGMPKGVMVEHRSLFNHMQWMHNTFPFTAQDQVLQKTPVSFDASVWEFYAPLLIGGTLLMAKPGGQQDAEYLVTMLIENRVTALRVVPSLLKMLLNTEGFQQCTDLRYLFCGGEPLTNGLRQAFYNTNLQTQFYNFYGPTEATIIASYWFCDQKILPIAIGKPISNIQIYILDANHNPTPFGIPGELCIAGAGLARGYLNRPELTADKFIEIEVFGRSQRIYKTGDLARYLPDGNLEYLGRLDHQIKLRGFRIELGEIEATLSQHGAIADAAVVLHDPDDNPRLVAYVSVISDQLSVISDQLSVISELRAWLKERLPEYMMPASFTVLDKLPLTPNGKIDRKALPAPDLIIQVEQLAPRSETERLLCNLWSQVLRIEITSVNSHFFEAGGHSLLATQLVSRIRETFQVEMPLRIIFECAILQEQAEWLDKQQRGEELPPIMPLAKGDPLVWSFAQQRLWFLAQLEGISATYNIPAALRFSGPLNETALQRAIIALIQRHDSLRLGFPVVDGKAELKLGEVYNPLNVTDLCELSEIEQQRSKTEWIANHAQTLFDLSTGPLLSLRLIKLGKQEHILLFNMHHIISDAWSMGVLIREFGQLYNAYVQNQVPQLSEPSIQYADYAAWQRNWLQGQVLEQQLAYWSEKLDGVPQLLELPTDYPRPAVMRYQGEHQQFKVGQELTLGIRQLSQRHGVTIFMTLLAAFKVLLYRYSGQNDLVVGSPIANRTLHQTEDLIGFFVNTLVLRTQVVGEQTFTSLLKQVRTMALEAYSHQDIPFEHLIEQLNPSRSMSYSPLFQVMFVLQNAPPEALELKDLKISFLESDNTTAKFDLILSITEHGEVLVCNWEYNTDLFRADTIARMAEHFQVLLDGIIENPEQLLSQLPLLTETEQQQLLAWNQTETDYPLDQTIVDLFQAQVAKTPENIAVIFENEQLSYQELNTKANQLAHYLMTLGVGAETLVGICVERSLEMVIGLLGILKAGGAYVPLDPTYPAVRLAFMLEDACVPVLLTQESLKEGLPETKAPVVCLDVEAERLSQFSSENIASGVGPDNLAYVIYTSGSTGQPKGAMNTHQAICNRLLWMQDAYQLTVADNVLQKTPFSFDVSVWEFFWPLLVGARLTVAKPGGHRESDYLIKLIEQEQITTIHFVPPMLQVFLDRLTLENCHSLKRVICSGSALPVELEARFFASCQPAVELHNLYGPTEAAVDVTYWACQRDSSLNVVPIGRPIANIQIYILDANHNPTPLGIPGELCIAGVGLARGYLNRPELTAEKFLEIEVFDHRQRIYKTGDLARWLPDGNIEYLDRLDHQIKLRGFRIELGEIEAVLGQHPNVLQTVVIVREDQPDNQRLVAYITSDLMPERIPYQTECLVKWDRNTLKLSTEDISNRGVLLGGKINFNEDQELSLHLILPGESEARWLKGKVAWLQKTSWVGIEFTLTPNEQTLINQSMEYLLETQGILKVLQRILAGNLRNYLKDKLPDYMIPSYFVLLNALPLTSNGKIDRSKLPAPVHSIEVFGQSQRIDKTGDLVLPNDNLEYLGKIEALLAQHPAVREGVVAKESDMHLTAYLVPDKTHAFPVLQKLHMEAQGLFRDQLLYDLPNGMTVTYLNQNETDFVYREIFEDNEYLKHGITLEEGDCVFDVGAHIGLFTLFAAQHSEKITVYAFEPIPPVFDLLRLNTQIYGLDVKAFNCGLSDESGRAVFTYYPHVSLISGRFADTDSERGLVKSFLLKQHGKEINDAMLSDEAVDEMLEARLESRKFTCQLRTVSDIIEECNIEKIDLLKVDVEKSELDVLYGIVDDDWHQIRQIVIEVHNIDGRLETVSQLLKNKGYELTVNREALLEGTELCNIYAIHSNMPRSPGPVMLNASQAPAKTWYGLNQLIKDVRGFLRENLPDYMIPSVFTALESLPLTPNGKIDRKALLKDSVNIDLSEGELVAPQTREEKLLTDIWAEVLGVDQVGIHDNFFDLGGHSLLLIQVQAKLQTVFAQKISAVELFEYPTIHALSQHLGPTQTREFIEEPQPSRRPRVRSSSNEIAIIGMSGRFPDAPVLEAFWQNLRNGVESVTFFSDDELLSSGIDTAILNKPNYVKAGAVLSDIEDFDALFFDVNPKEAEITDPQHRLFLECAWEAIENAGYEVGTDEFSIGVYAGVGVNTYLLNNLYPNRDLKNMVNTYQLMIGNDKDFLPTRVSYKLNLKGPSINVQTACSTSLVAVHLACQGLLNGECDLAMAGGVSVHVPHKSGYWYQEGMIHSPDGHCRAFDAKAQGTVGGNGVGIVVLKRLDNAIADGDSIHAIIKGSAINNDGAMKVGYTAPSVSGQAAVISEALAFADIESETISYVETHGTGTKLGDPIEIAALTKVFPTTTEKRCAIGSLKTNIGHTGAAAGVAGLIKTVLALKHQLLPPSLHFEQGNPQIDFANSPFYVNATLSQWQPIDGTPRRAGVSSFGIGGTNAHVILEEAPILEPSGAARPWQLLVISAKTPTALETASFNLATHLERHSDINFADVAYTLGKGRKAFGQRRFLVGQHIYKATTALRTGNGVFTHSQELKERPVVFMFSGQGAQYVNMALEVYQTELTFRESVDFCSEYLKPLLGLDLRGVLYPNLKISPNSHTENVKKNHSEAQNLEEATLQINQTAITQAALFVIEYALAKLWMEWGVRPDAMIGHSIGEYVAACLAGVFSLEEALSLVAVRGQMMQKMPGGTMLAVPLSEDQVQLGPGLSLAAVNAPGSCVVSGITEAVSALEKQLTEQGVECRRLHTSHAFHSEIMAPILAPFTKRVAQINLCRPKIPYLSNVTGNWITAAEATEPSYWAKHLRQTVRFADGIQQLLQQNSARILLEVGPGRTLTSLAKRFQVADKTDKTAKVVLSLSSLRHPQDNQSDVAFLLNTVGKLWLHGGPVDWCGFYAHEHRCRLSLPTYPFERQRYWIDPPKTAIPTIPATSLQLWQSVIAASQKSAVQGISVLDNPTYHGKKAVMDRLCVAYMGKVLEDLGAFSKPGEQYSLDEFFIQFKILPRYQQLLSRWLQILVEQGELQQDGEHYTNLRFRSREAFRQFVEDAQVKWTDEPQVIERIGRCGDNLAEVLVGTQEPLALLFSGAGTSSDAAESPVQESPFVHYYNSILRAVVQQVVKFGPRSGNLNILEIGAGSGYTTRALLPLLPPQQTSYTFTDVGRLFLNLAQQKFSEYSFVQYRFLDIEQQPQEQGYELHSFDMVVAVNMLHVTQRMEETIAHVRSLLAPNGLLLIWEITQPQFFFDITDGILMNRLEDGDRNQGNPFLSKEQWVQVLQNQGFIGIVALPETDVLGCHILVALADSSGEQTVPSTGAQLPTQSEAVNSKVALHTRPELGHVYTEPRNSTEQQISDLWQQSLGIEPIGIHDNFFELGGDSLVAVQLLIKLRKTFQISLSPDQLLQAPTVAQLTVLFEKNRSVYASQSFQSLPSSLVAIRPSGSKPPFFCIHPGGGNVLCYAQLARHLGDEQPFYGLKAVGLDGIERPLTRYEDMAANYIKALRVVQARGPYLLGGWSVGGVVAFEMAQQLRKLGEPVGLLALIDVEAPTDGSKYANLDDVALLAWFAIDFGIFSELEPALLVETLRGLELDEQLHYILAQAKKDSVLPATAELDDIRPLMEVFKANVRAVGRYVPQVYSGRITWFRAQDRLTFFDEFLVDDSINSKKGWGELSLEPPEIYAIPGNHYTIIAEPQVQQLAEQLRCCIDKIHVD